jgi:hypothetical protein
MKRDKQSIKVKAAKKKIGEYTVSEFPATIETPYGAFTLSPTEYYNASRLPMKLIISVVNNDVAAQNYQKLVTIDFEKKSSDFIYLDMETKNAPFAKKILSHVIDNYNREWDADKAEVTEKTAAFIDQRLALVSEQMLNADNEIKQFKDKNNLTDIEADVKYYFAMSGELQAGLMEAKTQAEMADILVNFLQDPANKYALIPFNMNAAETSVATVIAGYNEALMKRNEFHKSNVQSGLSLSLDEQVEAQRKNMLLSLDNMKKGLDIALRNLRKKEVEFNAKIGNIPSVEKQYIHLKREQEVQQTIYIFLLEMREETGVKSVMLLPKLKVIDAPYTITKPVSPDLKKIAILILFFGAGLPLAWLYIQRQRRKEAGGI